ncbi:MAG: hypothetical protein LR011_13290 [Verrucomicrobia bacterium]|nr:hypothetical protein [Verrucomicrobiota bacterium]
MAIHPVPRSRLQIILSICAILGSGWMLYRHFQSLEPEEPQSYFYDLSAKQLFIAPKSSVPPIQGIDDDKADAVRAVVVALDGNCNNPQSRSIAYLEMFSPELKKQFESFRSADADAPPPASGLSRSQAKAHHFVRRPDESDWHPIDSKMGVAITEGWNAHAHPGATASVCIP